MSLRPRTLRLLALGCLVAPALALAGCAADGKSDPTAGPAPAVLENDDEPAPSWPFWPASMRLHPLTRLVTDARTNGKVIEVRVEFVDREGHTTKGYGQLRIDLHDAADGSAGVSLADWNLDLRKLSQNRQYFDDVTFTYLFRLEIEPDQLPDSPVLRAYFLAANGEEMKAAMRLRME